MSDLPLALSYENVFFYSHLVSPHFANLIDLHSKNIPIPKGFLVTTQAHELFVKSNNLDSRLAQLRQSRDLNNPSDLFDMVNLMAQLTEPAVHPPILTEILQLNLALLEQQGHVNFETDKLLLRDSLGTNQILPMEIDTVLRHVKQSYKQSYSQQTSEDSFVSFLVQIIKPADFQGSLTTGIGEAREVVLKLNNRQFSLNLRQSFVEGELTTLLNSVQINNLVNLVEQLVNFYYLPQEVYFYISGNDVYFLDSKDASFQSPTNAPIEQTKNIDHPQTQQVVVDAAIENSEQKKPILPIIHGRLHRVNSHQDLSRVTSHEIAVIENPRFISPLLSRVKPRAVVFVGHLDFPHRSKLKHHRVPYFQVDNLEMEKKHHRYTATINLSEGSLSF